MAAVARAGPAEARSSIYTTNTCIIFCCFSQAIKAGKWIITGAARIQTVTLRDADIAVAALLTIPSPNYTQEKEIFPDLISIPVDEININRS